MDKDEQINLYKFHDNLINELSPATSKRNKQSPPPSKKDKQTPICSKKPVPGEVDSSGKAILKLNARFTHYESVVGQNK